MPRRRSFPITSLDAEFESLASVLRRHIANVPEPSFRLQGALRSVTNLQSEAAKGLVDYKAIVEELDANILRVRKRADGRPQIIFPDYVTEAAVALRNKAIAVATESKA